MKTALLAAAVIVGAAFVVSRRALPAVESSGAGWDAGDALQSADDALNSILPVRYLMWSPETVPAQYRAPIAAAEAASGIPENMLARLLYQESRFRPEIIDGRKKSPAGALGIAQFMPGTAAEMGINPLDPLQAIPAAGRYLRRLFDSTGSWALALAAYNWGIGNVTRKGIARAPAETRNYYTQILADLGMDGGPYA